MPVKDFDAFWDEQQKEEIKFKVFGKEETLPLSPPAAMILKMVRAQREYGNKDLPESVQLDLAFSFFSEAKVEEWSEKGMTIKQLTDLMGWITEQYHQGNAKTPKEGAVRG